MEVRPPELRRLTSNFKDVEPEAGHVLATAQLRSLPVACLSAGSLPAYTPAQYVPLRLIDRLMRHDGLPGRGPIERFASRGQITTAAIARFPSSEVGRVGLEPTTGGL